mmetsp:Transcript_109200/g.290156  ORF Transcript_109200/g.290156 Transcript_109200/m.290156 type:complete len:212 (-) Transcript_109200:254-889(-)
MGSTKVKRTNAPRSWACWAIFSTIKAVVNRNVVMSAGQDLSKQCPNCPNEQRTVCSADSPVQSETTNIGFVTTEQVSPSPSSSSSSSSPKSLSEAAPPKRILPLEPSSSSLQTACSCWMQARRQASDRSSPKTATMVATVSRVAFRASWPILVHASEGTSIWPRSRAKRRKRSAARRQAVASAPRKFKTPFSVSVLGASGSMHSILFRSSE